MAKAKKRQRRKDDRPGEILQAAIDEFAETGFASAKIEAIAARAHVAKGTVYLYYATKSEIFEAIVRDRISPVFARVAESLQSYNTAAFALAKSIGLGIECLAATVRRQGGHLTNSNEMFWGQYQAHATGQCQVTLAQAQ